MSDKRAKPGNDTSTAKVSKVQSQSRELVDV